MKRKIKDLISHNFETCLHFFLSLILCAFPFCFLNVVFLQGMFPEASKYSADIDSHMSSYEPHLDSDVFKNLKVRYNVLPEKIL